MTSSPNSKAKQGFFSSLGSPIKLPQRDESYRDSARLIDIKNKYGSIDTQETPKHLLTKQGSLKGLQGLIKIPSPKSKSKENSPSRKNGFFKFVSGGDDENEININPFTMTRQKSSPDQPKESGSPGKVSSSSGKGSSSPGKGSSSPIKSKTRLEDKVGFQILKTNQTLDEEECISIRDIPSVSFGSPMDHKFGNQDNIFDNSKAEGDSETNHQPHRFTIFSHLQRVVDRDQVKDIVHEENIEESPTAKSYKDTRTFTYKTKSSPEATLENIPKSLSSPIDFNFEISPYPQQINLLGQNRPEPVDINEADPEALPNFGNGDNNQQVEQDADHANNASPAEEPQSAEDLALELDMKLYVIRLLPMFIAFGICCLLLLLMVKNTVTYKYIFMTIYCYMVYVIIESGVRIKYFKRESWKVREDIFTAFDALCGIMFFYLIDAKFTSNSEQVIHASTPFTIISTFYIFLSKAPDGEKTTKLLLRSLWIIQSLMISLELNGYLEWDWNLIFGLSWIYLAVGAIYSSAFGIILVLMIIFFPLKYCKIIQTSNFYKDCAGIVWHFLFFGQSAILAGIIYGVVDAYSLKQGFSALKLVAYAGLCLNLFLTLYTVLIYKSVISYLKLFHTPIPEENFVPLQANSNKKAVLNIEVEKKESYFVMLSSTYFLPLQRGTFMKDQLGIPRIKRLLKSMKIGKQKTSEVAKVKAKTNVVKRKNRPVALNVLKQYKENLDHKFKDEKRIENLGRVAENIGRAYTVKQLDAESPDLRRSPSKHNATFSNLKLSESHIKPQFSADDLNNFATINPGSETNRHGEEKLCYLCYCDPPDAVLLNCGHAGICYTCAVALVEKTGLCMECRSEVQGIYKVDPNPKMSDIIKGVEFSKVNKNDPAGAAIASART